MSSDQEIVNVSATPAAPTPKKKAKSVGAKKPKAAPSHPKVSEMVINAITSLKERGGSSLVAIKKYIGAHYKVDVDRVTPFVKKYLKSAVVSGALVQTKGKGATGSFKLSATGQKAKEAGKKGKLVGKKETTASAVKKSKPASSKKAVKPKTKPTNVKQKKKVAKKPSSPTKKAASKAKSPKKAAKPSKPKTPKAKKLKAVTPKKSTTKKSTKK